MESEPKKAAKDQPSSGPSTSPPCKPLLVRKLTTLEDVRRVQARLVKEFLAGRLDAATAKTACYLTATLTATLKELKPSNGLADVVTHVTIGPFNDEEEEFIREMNSNILPPPEKNQGD